MKIPIAVILATTEFTFQAAAVQTEPIPTSLDTNLVGYTNASEASIPSITSIAPIINSSEEGIGDSSNVAIFNQPSKLIQLSPTQTASTEERRTWVLIEHKERLPLVAMMANGLLQNRRMARDLVEFLDADKPNTLDVNEWNDVIVRNLNLKSVPGMGQFDIDGLESSQQEGLLRFSSQVLGAATAIVLILAACSFTVVMDKVFLFQDRQALQNRIDLMSNDE
mmetsp:Transcript_12074/g.18069  ORF Transcript_12074/g.18069 Transcript_12074/m.18069 type:complete len:223 (-) Transcript_12074:53-721(-)